MDKLEEIRRVAAENADIANARAATIVDLRALLVSKDKEIYELKWALHIEVDGDHAEECDCKDHMEEARRLLGDFRCPGVHCTGSI